MKYTNKLLILLCVLLSVNITFAQTPKDLIKTIDFKIESKEYSEALKLVDKALKEDAFNAKLYMQRCLILGSTSEFNQARTACKNAINSAPNNAEAYIMNGILFYTYKYYDKALQQFIIADSLASSDSLKLEALTLKASMYLATRKYYLAEKEAFAALAIDSTNYGALANLAIVYGETGNITKCLEIAQTTLELYPEMEISYNNLGYYYEVSKQYEKAISTYNKGLERFPKSALIMGNKGYCLFLLGNPTEGLVLLNKAIELFPANPYTYNSRAKIYLSLHKQEEACNDLALAIQEGFTQQYGSEARDLQLKHCFK